MSEMYLAKVKVTPEMAYDLLMKNNKNRSISRRKVEMIINDIKSDRFELTHQPIAISEDGELVDGQHRLLAVYESGVPVDMFVAYNAPRSTKIDIGKPRDVRTALFMAGIICKESLEYKKITYPMIRMIVLEQFGFKASRSLSADELHAIYTNHKEDIDMIVPMIGKFSKTGVPVCSSAIAYVMLCAYKAGCPIDTISRWYKILCTGDYLDETMEKSTVAKAIMIFTEFARGKRVDVGTPADRREEFIKKAMSSLNHYERNEVVSKLYGQYCYPFYKLAPGDFMLEEEEA